MKAAVIVFPGSNCDRDVAVALEAATGAPPLMVWHRDTELPAVDLIVLPGGFSYGDYLRCGAMAAHSPVMREVKNRAAAGVPVLGICNGFQMMIEAGMLPGALLRNGGLRFVARTVPVTVEHVDSPFTAAFAEGEAIRVPVAHHDGNYFVDDETLERLEGEGRIALRYGEEVNGSTARIAGIFGDTRRVLGLMPHPERAADPAQGGNIDGRRFFDSIAGALA